jgi:hypothetical protein
MVVAVQYDSPPSKEKPLMNASHARLQALSGTQHGKRSRVLFEDEHGKKE